MTLTTPTTTSLTESLLLVTLTFPTGTAQSIVCAIDLTLDYTYVESSTCTTCTGTPKYTTASDSSWVIGSAFNSIAASFPDGLSFNGNYG